MDMVKKYQHLLDTKAWHEYRKSHTRYYRRSINADPKTKDEWRELLELLYDVWISNKHPITIYPPAYCKNALRLDGIIGHRVVGHYA